MGLFLGYLLGGFMSNILIYLIVVEETATKKELFVSEFFLQRDTAQEKLRAIEEAYAKRPGITISLRSAAVITD